METQPAPSGARNARATEREIYSAAVRLISERGYHGMSFRALASEVGLQMSSLYYHFPSKQDLMMAIMSRTMADLGGTVEAAIDGIDDPMERLAAAIRGHVLFHAHRRMEAFVTDSELRAIEPANRTAMVQKRDEYEGIFKRLLEEGIRAGAFRPHDVSLATYAVMAMCTGMAVWYRPEGRLSLEEIADAYASLFLEGIVDRKEDWGGKDTTRESRRRSRAFARGCGTRAGRSNGR